MFYSLCWQLSLFRATAPVSHECSIKSHDWMALGSIQFSVPWQKAQSIMKLQRRLFLPSFPPGYKVLCILLRPIITLLWHRCTLISVTRTQSLSAMIRASNVVAFPLVNDPAQPEKTTDISRRHHWFPSEVTSEKRALKFYTEDVSLPRSGQHF